MQNIFILAVVVACVSWTVTKEEIFQWFRKWCDDLKKNNKCKGWRGWTCDMVGYLPTCYYCLSHSVTVVVLLFCPTKLLLDDWRGYIVAFFVTVFIANIYLTGYNILRALLRWIQANADTAATKEKRKPPINYKPSYGR